MVSQITLGNFATQNGRTVLSGGQSGIDTEALINGLTEAKRIPAVRLEEKNVLLGTQKTALNSLQSLLTRFRTAADALRNPPGVQNASQNIFEYRTATLSSIVSAGSYLGVTVEPGANIQNLSIDEIEQLAKETKQETGTFLLPDATSPAVLANGDATAGQFSAGTFTLRVLDGGANASITLNEDESLQAVAAKFNAVKTRTGIQATVVKVATGSPNNSYKLIFTGTSTGLTGEFDLADIGTVITDPDGALSQVTSHIDFGTTQTAQNAKFTFDGVAIERETNAVDDLIDGITFTLKQVLSDTTPIAISIQPDLEIVTNALNNFADIYNELRVFSAQQNEIGDDGLPTEEAVLARHPTLRSIVTAVTNEITGVVAGLTGGSPSSLTEIGINFEDFEGDDETPKTRNIIVINAEALQSALAANFDDVRKIFEFSMTSDNANLAVFSRTNALGVNAFKLVLDRTNDVYEARDPTTDALLATLEFTELVSGTITLKGPAGTVLEGLELIYASTDDATINVTATQGIADRLFNEVDGSLDTDGSLTTSLESIEEQTARNKTEITKIDEFIERYREQLIDQYAKLEAALSKANQLLSLLDAQSKARENA